MRASRRAARRGATPAVLAQGVTASRLWNPVQAIRWDARCSAWRPQHASASCSPFTAPPQDVIDGSGASPGAIAFDGTTSEWLRSHAS